MLASTLFAFLSFTKEDCKLVMEDATAPRGSTGSEKAFFVTLGSKSVVNENPIYSLETDRGTYYFHTQENGPPSKTDLSLEHIYSHLFLENCGGSTPMSIKGKDITFKIVPFESISIDSPYKITGKYINTSFVKNGFIQYFYCDKICDLKKERWNIRVFFELRNTSHIDEENVCSFLIIVGLKEYRGTIKNPRKGSPQKVVENTVVRVRWNKPEVKVEKTIKKIDSESVINKKLGNEKKNDIEDNKQFMTQVQDTEFDPHKAFNMYTLNFRMPEEEEKSEEQ